MHSKFQKFLIDETAATAIEYAIIASGVALGIISAVNLVGLKLSFTFSSISTQLK
jgi:pilus assembly protein Flp/PilA